MIIENLSPLEWSENPVALWKKFLVPERGKLNHYKNAFVKVHFRRTHQQKEIDLVEQKAEKTSTYKFKGKN